MREKQCNWKKYSRKSCEILKGPSLVHFKDGEEDSIVNIGDSTYVAMQMKY